MWAEIIIVMLLIVVCIFAYGAMEPNQTCTLSVKKPLVDNSSNKTGIPDVQIGCRNS